MTTAVALAAFFFVFDLLLGISALGVAIIYKVCGGRKSIGQFLRDF